MEKDKLIKLLNEALQMEYADIFLYPREATIIKEKEISEKFEKFGRMELRHADNIAMQILTLGGRPNWEFTPLDTKALVEDMLLDHIEREKKAIQLYNSLIELADKEGQDQLKLILKGIREEEESHFVALKELTKKGRQGN